MRALLDPTSSYSAWASRAQRRTRGAHSGRRANHCCRARQVRRRAVAQIGRNGCRRSKCG